jgi:hypothetical protein
VLCIFAHVVPVALKLCVLQRVDEVRLGVAVDEVKLGPERLIRLDRRRDEANRVRLVLSVKSRIVGHTTREGGHRVRKEARGDDVGIPFPVAVSRIPTPRGHHAIAERIGGKTANVVAVAEKCPGDPAKPLEVASGPRRIERRHEVVHLNQRRRDSPEVPVWRSRGVSEARVDPGDPRRRPLVVIGDGAVGGIKDIGVGQNRRRVVRVANLDHDDHP